MSGEMRKLPSSSGPAPARKVNAQIWRKTITLLPSLHHKEALRTYYMAFVRSDGIVWRLLCLFVFIPSIIVFLYLFLFASPIYISEAKFAIRGKTASSSFDALASMLRPSGNNINDPYIVYNYIHSLDMITKLNAKYGIIKHYSGRENDIWYRLWKKPTQDDLLSYWNWAAKTTFDPDTGILTVAVKAFTPQMAQAICTGVLENSEALVNAMNERLRGDAISQAQHEVQRAEERIRAALDALKKYRESSVILDPQATATVLYNLVGQIEGELAKTKAELEEARTFMDRKSPRVVALQNRLKVLQTQLAQEKSRLASALEKDAPLSVHLSQFQALTLEEEFARTQLTTAMASLEAARVQAEAKATYLESFEKPYLPDESLYPRPFLFTVIFMVSALLILGLVSLIIAAIREHAGF